MQNNNQRLYEDMILIDDDDRLLVSLKNSGLGCHINGTYMGALSYADDIALGCPSMHGLNTIMNICSDLQLTILSLLMQRKLFVLNMGNL